MLLLTAGLLAAAFSRRHDVAVAYQPPEARLDDSSAALLAFPKAGGERRASDSKVNQGSEP